MIVQFSPTSVPSQKIECGLAHVIRRSVADEKRLLAPATGRNDATRGQSRSGAARLSSAFSLATSITTNAHLGHSNARNPGVSLLQLHVGPAVGAALRGPWRTNREQQSMTRGIVQFLNPKNTRCCLAWENAVKSDSNSSWHVQVGTNRDCIFRRRGAG
jgi:hypothetical protein